MPARSSVAKLTLKAIAIFQGGRHYQRRMRVPSVAPTAATMKIATPYQVATKSGVLKGAKLIQDERCPILGTHA